MIAVAPMLILLPSLLIRQVSVATGAIVAHVVATAGAVAGGAILSEYISEKVMGYVGGSLFIVFALTTAIGFF